MAAAGDAALAYATLKQRMGLPEGVVRAVPERALPSGGPAKAYAGVHKGGCTGLAFDRTGHVVATCGLDRMAATWDWSLWQAVNHYPVRCSAHVFLCAE
jgi:hypothetical protein